MLGGITLSNGVKRRTLGFYIQFARFLPDIFSRNFWAGNKPE
jgi:hypothetical protein